MNYKKIKILLHLVLFVLISCNTSELDSDNDSGPDMSTVSQYIPFFQLANELNNDPNTANDTITLVIDSSSTYKFDIKASNNTDNHASTFFMKVEIDVDKSIRLLNRLAPGGFVFEGPLLSTFDEGDTIKFDMPQSDQVDWFTDDDGKLHNTGWIKYHIYKEGFGSTADNFDIGNNYLVVKFGDKGEERMGWLNIVYQDTVCYVKEGFYNSIIEGAIVVGDK